MHFEISRANPLDQVNHWVKPLKISNVRVRRHDRYIHARSQIEADHNHYEHDISGHSEERRQHHDEDSQGDAEEDRSVDAAERHNPILGKEVNVQSPESAAIDYA